MFLFLKLTLAHFIADFVLQFEELFQLKLRSFLGHFLHALAHAVISIALLWPYRDRPFIYAFVAAMSVIHLFQDVLKYRFMEVKKYFFLLFVADQIVHCLFLATILLFPISREKLPDTGNVLYNLLYLQSEWTLYATLFLITTLGGSYLLNAFGTSYLKGSRPDRFITTPEIVHGVVERTVVTGLFLLSSNPLLLVCSPAVGLIRILFKGFGNKTDFLLSFVYAAWVGLVFRAWL
jgi:hypothetical protein